MKKILCVAMLLAACGTQKVKVVQGPEGKPGHDGANGADGSNGTNGTSGANGVDGTNGAAGADGHSIVSLITEVSPGVLCSTGGKSVDFYLDIDNSLSASSGDVYQGSAVTCNGLNGLAGQDGAAGVNGTNGVDGAQGIAGTDGAQGIPGEQGPQGIQGIQGEQGAAGAQGIQGEQGPVGPTGPTGPMGPAGAQGTPGTLVIITDYSSSTCTLVTGSSPARYAKSGDLYTISTCTPASKVNLSASDSIWVSASSLATKTTTSIRVITFN